MALYRAILRLGPKFKLPPLPYNLDALEPHISAKTLECHHGKHHQTYVNKLNDLVKDSDDPKHSKLESIIKFEKGPVYNQAAQIWNHNFYFQCLGTPTPDTDSPIGPTQKRIDRDFGSLENFKKQFKEKVLGHFGSGWVWLVYNTSNDKLELVEGHDAQCPLSFAPRSSPLLCCDVWEHAYYLDTQHDRATYFENFWKVINWHFVNEQFMNNLLETY
ncbi:hypothetical protein Efla_003149 [Eimeria flavescens]